MYKYIRPFIIAASLLVSCFSLAQETQAPSSSEIYDDLKKLNVLASVLYVAAHPDDENTRMISWLSNEVHANTAYLSLTRGDGGQNRIGTELAELLGLLRTQELLAARRIDGGQQFFSRANDFGYSKHPDETLKIWNEKEVLSDVVRTIRAFQPDIIINRFDHKSAGKTHGHHTASAILSVEAFDKAGDKNAFPEQLDNLSTWQPKRLFFNTSWWFYGSRENFAKADKSKLIAVDVGVFYPLLGKSNNEIAAASRSMHKCQAMGSTPSRGSMMEYLELVKGDTPSIKTDPFAGINTTWSRIEGGENIGKQIQDIIENYNYDHPQKSIPALLSVYKSIEQLPDSYWKSVKRKELKEIIKNCLGLYVEATANVSSATPEEEIEIKTEINARLSDDIELKSISLLPMQWDTSFSTPLAKNEEWVYFKKITLPKSLKYTNPYWLNEKGSYGMYKVAQKEWIGKPETPRELRLRFNFEIENMSLSFTKEVNYKYTDPVRGEVYRPFEITPPIFANIREKVSVFATDQAKPVEVVVKAGKDNCKGVLHLSHPPNWKVNPQNFTFELSQKGAEKSFTFYLTPPSHQEVGLIAPKISMNGKDYSKGLYTLDYEHIPFQTVFKNEEAKVVKIDLKKAGDKIAYLMGAGDKIPQSLRQIGYQVDVLEDSDIRLENLQQYDAVIVGVRAFNTNERLKFQKDRLHQYVEKGGTVIVQYNTAHRLKTKDFAPYPIKLSRKRVSVEESEVRILKPDHEVMNFPNKISSKDFDNWVQERGLYFPEEWDEKYEAILSSNDEGEEALKGGLLVASYGKGHFIYTSYSWFRELPAGVPGAYRIFTNLISIGKNE